MFGILLAVAALIAAGIFITKVIKFTFNYVKNKIQEHINKNNAKKTLIAQVKTLADNCPNKVDLKDLDNYDYVLASVDENGEVVGDMELITDENTTTDQRIERLLSDEGMVVVEA